MQEKQNNKFIWAVIATETSHVFCCVLPTLFSLISLLSGFGLIITIPGWMETLHDTMHGLELPMIVFSAFIVFIGWGLHYYSVKNDCHDHGCHHKPCGPRKRAASKILIAASVLLCFNLVIYFGVHRPADLQIHSDAHVESVEGGHGHDHDHHGHDH